MTASSLSPSERDLFRLVVEAAFVNPFSSGRRSVDVRMGGSGGLGEALFRVRSTLDAMRGDRRAVIRGYDPEDARLLQMAVLFDAFHRWAPEFDALIREQAEAGETPVMARFASDVVDHLTVHGIRQSEAVRLVGVFYQLRRAYTFIRSGLAGATPCMEEVRVRLWNTIFTCDLRLYLEALLSRMEDFSTLLLGDTGTGKGAAAWAVGRSGFIPYRPEAGRFAESFAGNLLAINLSQYPEALLESELFGHRKGAFTGAVADHDGVFARCSSNGSIFLDEIGEVPETVQIKLLQVLQERTFSPVGSHDRKRFEGRIIAATNRPLQELRGTGRFRDDFYYRLCSDVITLPTLRERLDEDPKELERLSGNLLSRHLGPTAAEALLERVMEALKVSPGSGYAWPGNVRELEQALRRILVVGRYDPGPPTSMVPENARDHGWLTAAAEGSLTAEDLLAWYCGSLWKRCGTYEEVARRTGLDRRTVKKYVLLGLGDDAGG
jgi:hypothetical protein